MTDRRTEGEKGKQTANCFAWLRQLPGQLVCQIDGLATPQLFGLLDAESCLQAYQQLTAE